MGNVMAHFVGNNDCELILGVKILLAVAIGHGEEPAGPHLDNPDLPEGTLKPLVANELGRRIRARDTRRWIIGTCIVGPFLVILGWVLATFFSGSSP